MNGLAVAAAPAASAERNECAHAGCACPVDTAGDYCAPTCRDHEGMVEAISVDCADCACKCGHAACGAPHQPVT